MTQTDTTAIRHADILIVGGGLSGAMLAVQLLRLPGRRRILVIEPRAELGRGEAYSAVELGHTLNGNAARMSVDPDNADDLTQWLTDHIAGGGWPESDQQHVPVSELFPPRGLFGVYVQQRLAEAQQVGAQHGSTVEHVRAEVIDVQASVDSVQLTLSDGQRLQGAFAVLATGMFPAARTPQKQSSGLNAAALDPWDVGAMRQLDPQSTVLIIGSGLTMVDAVVSLEQAGHRGPIEVFSRHGLLPHVRRQPPAWADFLAEDHSLRTPRQLLRELRRHCQVAIAQGIDWQAPLDTVRAHIGRLWSQASDAQRRQFVRHVRPWWESHHHRSPPLSAELVERLHREGRLRIHAASYKGLEPVSGGGVGIRVRRRGESETRVVQGAALINSSGIEYDWRRVDRPLPQQLLARGLVQPGPLALGIAAAVDGAVLDAQGKVSQRLFAMGPPLRGMWWESTAVTDVASQAKALAARLVAQ
ncbi:pyridine nucleotide-disulfide oxidoreductase [Pseudomonas sp. FW215-R2]|uniref:FAD/NAD(P)-binding protein n=1 Tax=unclassified Pseudomonas TaxID=196821 RepID=UPI000C887480|nr:MULTISPECIES: FAD/NAD(P)-binding protein [unclassified Pseudomonas]PMX00742.1 pyridine nucleotide-disulfide oxidoreductase [Pseudomonas sp. FW215-R2]PMX09287.1 pyridine nucleotide-disulfide oxidoreductase [Pseudomonas sp. FW215-L1]PMX22640.1 pyridine nucleotide-disulfide oxidoreductase [Pseudomonas sp. FW215-E1]PNA30368.1 pyridine nucleotide-disulfide oxidoreductase [Pseudomonas sp. FW215-R4]